MSEEIIVEVKKLDPKKIEKIEKEKAKQLQKKKDQGRIDQIEGEKKKPQQTNKTEEEK